MLGNLLSRLLGYGRGAVIAAYFGTGPEVRGYFGALKIQTSLYDLLVSGVISAAFIPVFSAIRDDDEQFRRVGGTVLTITVAAMLVAMAALELLAGDVVALIVHDRDPLVAQTSVDALRLMAPAVVFLGASGVLTALLYARQRFIFPAFTPAIFNLAIVCGAISLHGVLGVHSLVIGVVGGACAQVLLQTLGLRRLRLRPSLALRHPRVVQIGRLYWPVLLGLIITQIQVLVDLGFASSTGRGLAYLTNATNIYQLPLGIVATAMSLASLPTLSRLEGAAFRSTLSRGLLITLLLIVPAVAICLVLPHPVIELLLHTGSFTASDTANTAEALRYYTPGLGFAALDQLLIFAFYARNDTRTPVVVGVISIAFYLVVALLTLHPLSFRGLALADAAKQVSHAVILYILLVRRQGRFAELGLRGTAGKVLLAGLALGAFYALALRLAGPTWVSGKLHAGLFLVVIGGGGVALYLLALAAWRVPELNVLGSRFSRRLARV
jgi:putative peptidoglycan lipid II flippase